LVCCIDCIYPPRREDSEPSRREDKKDSDVEEDDDDGEGSQYEGRILRRKISARMMMRMI